MHQKEKMESVLPMSSRVEEGSMDPDMELVERLQKGDMAALEELVHKYQKWVYSLAYRTVRNHADADDVTQETFIRVYRHIDKYQEKPGHAFAGWLYRVTVNLSLNQAKKRRREESRFMVYSKEDAEEGKENPIDRLADQKSNPGKEVERKELKLKIDEILEGLSAEHRATFTLCEMQGYSYKEIAEIMDCPIGTVMSRLHYTKKILKEKLKKYL